jgi:DNA-binding transcriptional regulator LsrR (DeoR family)
VPNGDAWQATPNDGDATALASQVARLFFDRQVTKVEIATRLGISRFRVARLIDQARAQGLVRIEFRDVPEQHRALASEIEQRWGVDLCVVAGAEGSRASGEAGLPRVAASVISGLIGAGETIGIAWGSTLAAVVREMPARADPSISVVQLAGSSTRIEGGETPGELAHRLADRLGGHYHALFAPAFVESPELRDALSREPEIRETIARFSQLKLALIGIGALEAAGSQRHSSLFESGVLTDGEIARIEAAGAVGDVILLPFDAAGRFLAPDLMGRAIGISVEQLRDVPRVVAVAGGSRKAQAIAGALRTGLINVLVTDEDAAESLAQS